MCAINDPTNPLIAPRRNRNLVTGKCKYGATKNPLANKRHKVLKNLIISMRRAK